MPKAVTQGDLVAVTKLMIHTGRGEIQPVCIGEESAIAFKLAVNKLISCNLTRGQTRYGAYCKTARQGSNANICGKDRERSTQTRNVGCAQRRQLGKNGFLLSRRPENAGIG